MQMSPTTRKWLKAAHTIFAGIWTGSLLCMLMLILLDQANPGDAAVFHRAARLIDDAPLVPAALGTLFTGLAFSLATPWGFFRHRWLTVKWLVTVGTILTGMHLVDSLFAALVAAGADDPRYASVRASLLAVMAVQAAALACATVISVFKPWGSKKLLK